MTRGCYVDEGANGLGLKSRCHTLIHERKALGLVMSPRFQENEDNSESSLKKTLCVIEIISSNRFIAFKKIWLRVHSICGENCSIKCVVLKSEILIKIYGHICSPLSVFRYLNCGLNSPTLNFLLPDECRTFHCRFFFTVIKVQHLLSVARNLSLQVVKYANPVYPRDEKQGLEV